MRTNALKRQLIGLALGCCAAIPAHALVILTGSYSPATPDIVDSNVDSSFPIPDSDLWELPLPVNIGSGTITKVTIAIDLFKCGGFLTDLQGNPVPDYPLGGPDNVSDVSGVGGDCVGLAEGPASAREIVLRLKGPGGTVNLVEPGIYGDGPDPGRRIMLTFEDGKGLIEDALFPFVTGTFAPRTPFVDFDGPFAGEDAAGPWSLLVGDDTFDSPLGIVGYTLNVTVRDQTGQVPEPATLGLLGLGLAGLTALRRRRTA